ncbi:MAG: hypothetical protein ACRC6A_12600, partial [Fusobacteriaceae bacterium]
MAFKTQNMFTYGSLGSRLDGVRNSEIYKQGAREIDNMFITDIGTLKVAKQYSTHNLFSGSNLIAIKSTSFQYYIVLTSTSLIRVQEKTNAILQTVNHGMSANVNANLVGNDSLVLYDGTNTIKMYSLKATGIEADTATFANMKLPVKKRDILQLDLWKVTKNPYFTGNAEKDPPGTNPLRIVQMSAFSDPLIKVTGTTIMLHNSDITINRIYTSYNSAVAIEYFTAPAEGQIYGILRNLPKIEDSKEFIVDQRIVNLGALTNDAVYKGAYFTTMAFKDGKAGTSEGTFTFGQLVPNITTAEHVSFYQDRLFLYKDGYFYVSKIGDYSDFRNATFTDSAFFFQLNPISGRSGSLINTISDIGLFVLTTSGVYIIGYGGAQLTPGTFGSSIIIASDSTVTSEYCIKDNVLYFLNKQGVLKSVLADRLSQQVAFNTTTVDKYTSKKLFKGVSKITIEDREYVACVSQDSRYVYLIEPINASES